MPEQSRQHPLPRPFERLQRAAAQGARMAVVAILTSVVLATVKIAAGLVGHSYALVADGVESVLDIIGSLVVWGSLRIGTTPPSREYPYGLGKVEPLAALVVASLLMAAAVGIAVEAVHEIRTPHVAPAPFTLGVLIVVVATKEALFRWIFRTGESIGSQALRTDAWHHRSDALTSAAAFVGISVALVAGEGYESADDWAALFACAVILWNGQRLFRTALREVLDAAPAGGVEDRVREVAAAVEGVRDLDECRIRRSGLGIFVDIHVQVDADLPVRMGHGIAHEVKDALVGADLDILDVLVHIEPYLETEAVKTAQDGPLETDGEAVSAKGGESGGDVP